MSTITKEWLQQKIADMEATRDEIPFGLSDDGDKTLAALRIALASLEAEPAGIVRHIELRGPEHPAGIHVSLYSRLDDGIELYTAPPAPVSVPDEVLKRLLPDAEKSEFWFEHDGKILFEGVKFNNAVFDACRAAMPNQEKGNG